MSKEWIIFSKRAKVGKSSGDVLANDGKI